MTPHLDPRPASPRTKRIGLAVLLGSAAWLGAACHADAQTALTLPSGVAGAVTGTVADAVSALTAGAGGTALPVASAADLRQVANLADAAGTDTVNVGELRGLTAQLGASTAAALGGGSIYNPLLGTVTLPSLSIRGTAYANVDAALDALDVSLRGSTGSDATNINNNNQTYVTNNQFNNFGHGTVQYDRGADGTTIASVTLNSDAGGPVVIHNLAPGVAVTDAATVGQVQAVANDSVQYTTVNGVKSNTVMLSGGSPGGVTISNLAPGQQGTDAVNLNQLRAASAGANSYTDGQIGNLRAFTDKSIASARRDAAGGTAVALAATGIRFDDRPGKISVGGATSYYDGQAGFALGVGATSETGRVRVNAAISASPTIDHPQVGGVVGASFAIN